jgi:hypothetical protein
MSVLPFWNGTRWAINGIVVEVDFEMGTFLVCRLFSEIVAEANALIG